MCLLNVKKSIAHSKESAQLLKLLSLHDRGKSRALFQNLRNFDRENAFEFLQIKKTRSDQNQDHIPSHVARTSPLDTEGKNYRLFVSFEDQDVIFPIAIN